MASVIYSVRQLPPRIQTLLVEVRQEAEVVCAIKTAYKPNATIPILWLVLTKTELILCNTHRTRGLTARHPWNEINLVRKTQENGRLNSIEIIFNSLEKENIVLPLASEAMPNEIEKLINDCVELKGT